MVVVPEHSATEADRMELTDLDGSEFEIAQGAEGLSVRHVAPGSISQSAWRRRGSESSSTSWASKIDASFTPRSAPPSGNELLGASERSSKLMVTLRDHESHRNVEGMPLGRS
jgi:hypothetical protein